MINTEELVRTWLRAAGLRRACLFVRYPGRLYAAQRAGDLTTDAVPKGEITWYDYLLPPPAMSDESDDFASEHTASPPARPTSRSAILTCTYTGATRVTNVRHEASRAPGPLTLRRLVGHLSATRQCVR
ncbi:hypothetical protein ACFQYP_08115 [Nonomuraea antimicrobica]